MPNIASVLKEEIARVARKELRVETEKLKKASAQYRSEIAALKRRLAVLEQQVGRLGKATKASTPKSPEPATSLRFSAKGFSTQRQKLGLSAADMGVLLGVSAQTVYNWEAEKARPRQQQMAAIAAVRGMGKRDAAARLAK
ncbi:MAG: helix-turn-helix domain-containing protein [Gammaproteobacteria bacterium]|nr:helix-turn-helix domain-containing protein [Gammaproteobacteria bacterium]MBU1646552.1 helix-turn-helix domain-containing protein [Gammaproteobacteria bacterium]MBU1972809.1 helix-turn-helix domain-containing protein [Gammaproteobacteria bacterium]